LGDLIYGFVTAIESRGPSWAAPPFLIELYSPSAKVGEQIKKLHLEEVCDNKELVLVSVLRDAFIHSLPVKVGYDVDSKSINAVEVRTTTAYDEWETKSIAGKIKTISVEEFGLGIGNNINPNLAKVVIQSGSDVELFLNLQRAERETKLAQLSILQQAYKDESDVIIKYHNKQLGGDKTAKVIIGVQLGASGTKILSSGEIPIKRVHPRLSQTDKPGKKLPQEK
jgi:hypothetical protein